jgi:lysine 2,3-aminomutase
MLEISKYTPQFIESKVPTIFALARQSSSASEFRSKLSQYTTRMEFEAFDDYESFSEGSIIRVRDCSRILNRIITRRSENMADFSVAQALYDVAVGTPRPDLAPAFFAEILHLLLGLEGRGPGQTFADIYLFKSIKSGRKAAKERSRQLNELNAEMQIKLDRYASGLEHDAIKRRLGRRQRIISALNANEKDFANWQWQISNILRDPDVINSLCVLSTDEKKAIETARRKKLPFGITPYYLSLMDDDPEAGRDQAIRAQVIPPLSYVNEMDRTGGGRCFDFMREADTSPIDLITRRYPNICILKPYNTCPQICVYCQRNWEIEDAMEPEAMASEDQIDKAIAWIKKNPAIHEVLVTGGDPLALPTGELEIILDKISRIASVERIRIGSRVPVTMPMRIDKELADTLARYRIWGRRQVALVTHVQHSYEITPDTLKAVKRLRKRGISVYNQLVYTFYISRRFEAAKLRRILNLIGIDPYYTFNTKGKEETHDYRVPIARLMQEQKEEARLLPGLARTDEAVYNVPGLGKNYLKARQHRDLISILSDGSRLYEFHPWEQNISAINTTFTNQDVPILDYLQRLESYGEDVTDYETIWYYI